MLECCVSVIVFAALSSFIAAIICMVVLLRSDADLSLTFMTKLGKQPESLARKVVWITGASSGIGEYIAYELARAGCRLILSARRKEELNRVKEACLKKGKLTEDDIMTLPLDVLDFDSHKTAVAAVLDKFGQIDVLLNNAGKSQRAAFLDVELSVDREQFEINVLAPVSLTHAVLPHMIGRRQGQIAVTSSLAGVIDAPMSRSYTGTKHAVQGYFGCLQTEMLEHNIDVTLICPGPVFSNLLKDANTGKPGERVNKEMHSHEKRMSTERCAYLSCVAIANRMGTVWMALHPTLLITYLSYFLPALTKFMVKKIGLSRIMSVRDGGANK